MNKLEQMLLEGLESGDPIPATPEFWEKMRQDLIERNQPKSTPREPLSPWNL